MSQVNIVSSQNDEHGSTGSKKNVTSGDIFEGGLLAFILHIPHILYLPSLFNIPTKTCIYLFNNIGYSNDD